MIVNGPDVPQCKIVGARLVDIVPTLLDFMAVGTLSASDNISVLP